MKYQVHLYVQVRCKVANVEADSQESAVALAQEAFYRRPDYYVASGEYADMMYEAYVDESDDPEFVKSRAHAL